MTLLVEAPAYILHYVYFCNDNILRALHIRRMLYSMRIRIYAEVDGSVVIFVFGMFYSIQYDFHIEFYIDNFPDSDSWK